VNLPPGPKGHFLVGCLPELSRDFLGFLTSCAREYGDIVPVNAAGHRLVIVSHPDAIEEVLMARAPHLSKSTRLKQHLFPVIGEGILLSEGDLWLRQRRLMQPAFHPQRVAGYGELMVRFAELAMADWKDGDTRDIHAEMMAVTQAIVAKTLFDIEINDAMHRIGEALQLAMAAFLWRDAGFIRLPDWVPTRARARRRNAVARLDQVVYDIITTRRASADDRGDLLSILLHAQDAADGSRMSDRQVRDEVVTLFLAGQETTALALSCTWYLLARHPEVEARLEAEFAAVLGGRPPTLADLPRLPYTEMVIKESMRLYPPAYAVFRRVADPCEVAGYRIERETTLVMPEWVVHRDSRWFENPEEFRPSRWETGLATRLPRYAYFPFGGGMRRCLGNTWAMMEARLVLATIGQRFRFSLVPGESVTQLVSANMQRARGLRMCS
jgi:cytochrome P450